MYPTFHIVHNLLIRHEPVGLEAMTFPDIPYIHLENLEIRTGNIAHLLGQE